MQLAVISDVHADFHALRDALAQIDRLGCDSIVCAGDLVNYGLFPQEAIDLLIERKIVSVRGNHDRWAIDGDHDVSGWDLSDAGVHYLASLPPSWAKTIEGVRVAVWHARPGDDMQNITPDTGVDELHAILDEASADVLIVGHTHVAMCIEVGDRLIVNPGALLRDPEMPTWTQTPGTFGVLELPSRRWTAYRAGDGAPAGVLR